MKARRKAESFEAVEKIAMMRSLDMTQDLYAKYGDGMKGTITLKRSVHPGV